MGTIKYYIFLVFLLLQACTAHQEPKKQESISVYKECGAVKTHTTAKSMIDDKGSSIECPKKLGKIINENLDKQINDLENRDNNPFENKSKNL